MTERGTGRTTRALIAAPKDAIYLVPDASHMYHTRDLAKFLDRKDIQVMTIENAERLRGTRRHIVFDHYCVDHMNEAGERYRRELDYAMEIAKYSNGRFS